MGVKYSRMFSSCLYRTGRPADPEREAVSEACANEKAKLEDHGTSFFGYIACRVTVVYTDVHEPKIDCVKLIKDTALAIYDEPFMLLYISVLRNRSEQWIEDTIKR